MSIATARATIIDAHQHFWQYDAQEYPWIPATASSLQADHLPNDLWQAAGHLRGSVAVQARQTTAETDWLLSLARDDARLLGVVGWVPLHDGIAEDLARWRQQGPLVGMRHVVQDEADPDFLLRPTVAAGLRRLVAAKLSYDLLIYWHQLPQAIACVDAHQDLHFVLDHAAKPPLASSGIAARQQMQDWRNGITALAQRQHVVCKLSGLVTEYANPRRWQVDQVRAIITHLIATFGPHRLCFGSDWPVCRLGVTHQAWQQTVAAAISELSSSEQAAIWAGTAQRVYRLADRTPASFNI